MKGVHDVYNDDQTFGLVENDLEESGEEEQKFRWEVRYTNTQIHLRFLQKTFLSNMNLYLHIVMVYNNNFLGVLFVCWMWLHIERTG